MRPIPSTWTQFAAKALLIATLSIPAIVALRQDGPRAAAENRHLAQWPARPATWQELLAMPARIDAWVNDHFGFRNELVEANNQLRFALFKEFPSIQVAAGQHGRYFLAAHGTNVAPYQALTTVCGKLSEPSAATVGYLNQMFAEFNAMGLYPKLMIVPSSPVVHSEDVPAWLVPSCAESHTPVNAVLESPALDQPARGATFFPLAELRDIGKRAELYPRTWFHWSGPGLDEVARLSLTRLFENTLNGAGPPLRVHTGRQPSDVSHLFPGVELSSDITQPDLGASQVKACFGGACYPELQDIGVKLDDVTRFENPAAPKRRLLLISDSFGGKISPWYARYYGQVEHIAVNNMAQLSVPQVRALRQYLFRDPAGTDILLLFHDGGAVYDTLKIGVHRLHNVLEGSADSTGAKPEAGKG